ncbi:MAG: fibrobacter succinogenes major paralogous domain-containing protein [Bacteroidota bacterium]|nr:fibrobacter succinogenes major paralogous domain-containing protein [Bacteroidota bacterium]
MKKAILLFLIFSLTTLLFSRCNFNHGELKDIEGNSYQLKKFNEQIWMTENLKVKKSKEGESLKFFMPANDSNNVEKYGLLYDFETACKICPKGWHLPTDREWRQFIEFVGENSGNEIKESLYWTNRNQKFTNKSGFSIRPAGYGNTEFENFFGTKAIFWTATKVDSHFVWGTLLADQLDSFRFAPQHPHYAFSVRCVQDK